MKDAEIALLIVTIVCVVFSMGALAYQMGQNAAIPKCQEDVVLVGVGQIDGTGTFENGRWTAYACGPALDDFLGD